MARPPETTWQMLDVAMQHYQSHLADKKDRFTLTIVDLLHISNFKGGNASITEPQMTLSTKLRNYERGIREIATAFGNRTLRQLTSGERTQLIRYAAQFLKLTRGPATRIRGFGPSYASAILAAMFPLLLPVLDRRALNGAGIPVQLDSQRQVKAIWTHYGALIDAFAAEANRRPKSTLRELDKAWFCRPLPGP